MANNCLSASDFIVQLECICESEGAGYLSLDIDTTKVWPHFSIACNKGNTAVVRGFYVENGDSFWRVSESAREVFTRNALSAGVFLEDIRAVVHIIVASGCTEMQWKHQNGDLVRSMIRIQANGKKLIFGKPPSFWQRGLIKEQIDFVPCR